MILNGLKATSKITGKLQYHADLFAGSLRQMSKDKVEKAAA